MSERVTHVSEPVTQVSEPLTLNDLQQQINRLGGQFRALTPDNLFVVWYLSVNLVDDEKTAAESVVGGSRDKSVDAVYIDEEKRRVHIVQGKFREKIKAASEKRSDVIAFAHLADVLYGATEVYDKYTHKIDPLVAHRLKEARERIQQRQYTLELHYVTLGKCSDDLRQEAEDIVQWESVQRGVLRLFDGDQVLDILNIYLDGAAPPIPEVDLRLEPTGAINRFDSRTGIDSWVFTMRGKDIGELYRQAGTLLFGRNIRGFLRRTKVNAAMATTLETEPQYFWYFNNGVTIVCDDAKKVQKGGHEFLQVKNLHVINGQQTTRMLDEAAKSPAASVLVRVITIPRAGPGRPEINSTGSSHALFRPRIGKTPSRHRI